MQNKEGVSGVAGPVSGASNKEKIIPVFKELLKVQQKKQVAGRQLPCCGLHALAEENPGHSENTRGPGCQRNLPREEETQKDIWTQPGEREGRGVTYRLPLLVGNLPPCLLSRFSCMATFSFPVSLPVVCLGLYSTPSSVSWQMLASFSFTLGYCPLRPLVLSLQLLANDCWWDKFLVIMYSYCGTEPCRPSPHCMDGQTEARRKNYLLKYKHLVGANEDQHLGFLTVEAKTPSQAYFPFFSMSSFSFLFLFKFRLVKIQYILGLGTRSQ